LSTVSAVKKTDLRLMKVDRESAMEHALKEARVCINAGAFCACLAMLRKALDLWTAEYRDRFELVFGGKERDTLHWRLQKIADANPIYAATVHAAINGLKLDANDALHDEVMCQLVSAPNFTQPYWEVLAKVVNVVLLTHPWHSIRELAIPSKSTYKQVSSD